jgi:hypothetical protein
MSFNEPTRDEIAAEINESLKQFVGVNNDKPNLQATIAKVLLDQVDNLRKKGKISIPMPRVDVQLNGNKVNIEFYDDYGNKLDMGALGIPNYSIPLAKTREENNFGKAMLRELREMNQYLRSSTIDKDDSEQILDLLKVIECHVKIATKP